MNTKTSKIFLVLVVVLLFTASMVGQANAQLQFDLDYEFSTGVDPSGTGPWLTATIDNSGSNSVLLSMDANGLNGSYESIKGWYFNFDQNANNLTFEWQSGAQATTIYTDNNTDDSALKADGDGYFDFRFEFANDAFGNDSGAELTSVYKLIYGSDITYNNFDLESAPDGNPGVFFSAGHVQDINGQGQDSGWIGASTTSIVPEPISSTLFLVGAATLGFRRFRKRKSIS